MGHFCSSSEWKGWASEEQSRWENVKDDITSNVDLPENYPFKCSPVLPARDLRLPRPLQTGPVSYLLIAICFMSPSRTSPVCVCVCCTCILFKAPALVHFINSHAKDRNSLASVISLMILNKVNTNVDMAFAREEHQEWGVWPPAHVLSDTRTVWYTQQEGPGVVSCTI